MKFHHIFIIFQQVGVVGSNHRCHRFPFNEKLRKKKKYKKALKDKKLERVEKDKKLVPLYKEYKTSLDSKQKPLPLSEQSLRYNFEDVCLGITHR